MKDFFQNIRDDHTDFNTGKLEDQWAGINPTELFQQWLKNAYDEKCPEPNAMTLCTVNEKGFPSARVLYLKEWASDGLVFYTNYNSRKAQEIAENPNVTVLFFWEKLARQIQISGTVEKAPKALSDEYFASRPRASKIGAWASRQSEVVQNREALEQNIQEMEKKFENQEIPRPDFWGGYIIKPTYFEFWQGRQSRLHDRICFQLDMEKNWFGFRRNP